MDSYAMNILKMDTIFMGRWKRQVPRPGSELVKLKIGIVYCDNYEPTHLQVVSGIWDYLKINTKGSTLNMFVQGPSGLMKSEYEELNTSSSLSLCPLLIPEFGKRGRFDTLEQAYSTMIDKIMKDARSRGECYHFVRLSGHAASKITLECALQTHPNIALIGDELSAKKLTFKDVRDQIVDVICKRSVLGYNYGVILIPEDLIYFIPEIRKLFAELNKIFSVRPCVSDWMEKLTTQSTELINVLPQKTWDVVRLRSNPCGFPLIPEIDTEWTLIEVVKTELEKRKKKGLYKGDFKGIPHYTGCWKPEYDCCYKLGYDAGELTDLGRLD